MCISKVFFMFAFYMQSLMSCIHNYKEQIYAICDDSRYKLTICA